MSKKLHTVNAIIITGSLLVLPTLLLPASTTSAQQGDEPRVCANDIRMQCAGISPGDGRIRACIKAHFKDLSEPCQVALLKAAAVSRACASDVKENCGELKPGSGTIEGCMKTHLEAFSDSCKETLSGFASEER